MFQPGYFITAELRAKNPQRLAETKNALIRLCEESVKETGCSLFSLHQCNEDPLRFILWERFEDEAAFQQHFEESHTKAYVALDLTDIVQYFQTSISA